MPAPTHTLEYGQIQTLGPVTCVSETVGVMCIDNETGHYFFVSRETVQLGSGIAASPGGRGGAT